MSEEIELAAKSVGESVGALAEVSGVLGPVQELGDWVTSFIHYRRQPALAKQVMKAAEKIRAAGLPSEAVSDKLLRDLLEGGSMEDDESMQDRWANLLANAMTANTAQVRTAFPSILAELEPEDAVTLERFATHNIQVITLGPGAAPPTVLDNLTRLGLLRYTRSMPITIDKIDDAQAKVSGVMFTELGQAFLNACQEPQPTSLDAH